MITTERMVLRRFDWTDLDAVVELHNDPDVMHHINNGAPVARIDVANEVGAWITAPQHDPGDVGVIAAIDRSSDAFVGWFHLCRRDVEVDADADADADVDVGSEIGFRLCRSAWGRGLATEGSIALIDVAFTNSSLDRIFGQTMLVHDASRRVMEKAGMRLVRTFPTEWPIRIPGDELGDVEYEVRRTQWAARRAAGT